jgi:hypothetical protein
MGTADIEQNENNAHFAYTEDYGYVFTPPCSPDYPMYRQLDVFLHAQPIERHFNPELVQVMITSRIWETEWLEARHPWQREEKQRVIPSWVIMKDRVNKVRKAFTFGGKLQIITEKDRTRCTLNSPAPIFPLTNKSSVAAIFADEAEILLAKRRKAWDVSHPKVPFEDGW